MPPTPGRKRRVLPLALAGACLLAGATAVAGLAARERPAPPPAARVSRPFNTCPTLQSLSATPSAAAVGEVIDLRVTGADPDGDVALRWTAPGGRVLSTMAGRAGFRCARPGRFVLTAAVSDGQCTVTDEMEVTCLEPTAASLRKP